jgi:hypothetical protein
MTKVQIRFTVQRPLDDAALAGISLVNSKYGIQKIQVSPDMNGLTVEYDATRLRPAEVEAALAGAGIAVLPA